MTLKQRLLKSLIDSHKEIIDARGALVVAVEDQQTRWEALLKENPTYEFNEVDIARMNGRVYEIKYDIADYGVPEINDVTGFYEIEDLGDGNE